MALQDLSDSELLELFNIVDADRSGTIDREELLFLLHKVGFHEDKEEIDAIVASVDKDGSGDPYEFIQGFQTKVPYEEKEVKAAFAFFAKGTPKGLIKTKHLVEALSDYNKFTNTESDVDKLVQVMVDMGKDIPDVINYNEFAEMIVSGQ
ncbi:MAG: hypothetical protein EZS28_001608 [Streblomastix strix]|uniref:EF-hand domain-containing protein n=1 Tax=Streblomastix strix TaxID=222440 RepID=A0A5J4X8K9_9EUKA|nr:MAG: hypothetical protein EZS28_001608 [Streblomastix strix]